MFRSLNRLATTVARVALAVALPVVLPLHRSDAQGVPAQQGVPRNRTHVFAINPLGIPFEIVSIEVEQAIQSAFSLGANFSYFSPDDFTRSSFEFKGHLYPNEEAPSGFGVALGLGFVNTRENMTAAGTRTLVDKTSPSIGLYADYNWLLGRSQRFYVGTGLGAKRILGDSDAFDEAPFVYGTARFVIGVAF